MAAVRAASSAAARLCRRFGAILLAACSGGSTEPAPIPEKPVVPSVRVGLPPGWYGGVGTAGRYEIGLDDGVRRTGGSAAYLTARSMPASTDFSFLAQSVSAITYRAKRLRLSAWVRADSISGDGAGLWMRIDGPTRTLVFDNMIVTGRAIRGTSGWVEHSVVLDIPAEAVTGHDRCVAQRDRHHAGWTMRVWMSSRPASP